jgi:hypothetical protein
VESDALEIPLLGLFLLPYVEAALRLGATPTSALADIIFAGIVGGPA